jgi:hypothetical protein
MWWVDGSALWWALRVDALTTPFGRMVADNAQWILRPLTFITIYVEAFAWLLPFSPWKNQHFRLAAIAIFVALHVGFGAFLAIGLFWMISIAGWLIFLPPMFWDALEKRLSALRLPLLPGRSGRPHIVLSAFVIVCMLMVSAWNLRTFDAANGFKNSRPYFPQTYNQPFIMLRLDQYWAMFSPTPPKEDGWFVPKGKLMDGTYVDLRTGVSPPDYSKPGNVAGSYWRQRWRKYLFSLNQPFFKPSRKPYADWLQMHWTDQHPNGPRVVEVELMWVVERSLPRREAEPEPRSIGRWVYR